MDSQASLAELKEAGKALCVVLAMLYGKSLERVKLWDRIDSAFISASAKIQDGDMDRLITVCLEHVKAESIVCLPMESLMRMLDARPAEWRQAFMRYLGTHHYAVVIHGRLAWESIKAKKLLRTTMYGEVIEFNAAVILDAETSAAVEADLDRLANAPKVEA
jgi:hypothetical protein